MTSSITANLLLYGVVFQFLTVFLFSGITVFSPVKMYFLKEIIFKHVIFSLYYSKDLLGSATGSTGFTRIFVFSTERLASNLRNPEVELNSKVELVVSKFEH